jgi:outer membrane protein assembly factor BamE (lipoprotein component of BamABCDE complex)
MTVLTTKRRARKTLATIALGAVLAGGTATLSGCGGRIDRHGHVFTEADLQQVQTGMSKDQVQMTLGTPDTTGTVGGDVYYYISSTQRTRPMGKPRVVDRKVVAVYFDQQNSVRQVANYGLKDGVVFDFVKGQTPSSGKEVSALEQLLGNIANRRELLKGQDEGIPGRP